MNDDLHFFAEVRINESPDLDPDLSKQIGVVIGKSQDEETKEWFYTVMVHGLDEAVVIRGVHLAATGRILPREAVYSGESRRVTVDPSSRKGDFEESTGQSTGQGQA
jgi:hypothetical protein